jgi:acyl carrier protein
VKVREAWTAWGLRVVADDARRRDDVLAPAHGSIVAHGRRIKSTLFKPPLPPGNTMTADKQLLQEVASLLVEALHLEVAPEAIDPNEPLYGDGLGLDSIDMLEVSLVVSRRYGVQLRADDDNNEKIFGSLASLANHIAAHRTT